MIPDAELSDSELVARALAGEKAPFTELMGRHKSGLYRFIRRYVGDNEDVYDLLQDSFLSAWFALKRYDSNRSFSTWLRSIALNKCRDWSRRRAIRSWLTRSEPLDSPVALAVPDSGLSPEAIIGKHQFLAQLDRTIVQLPQTIKEPFILTIIDGLTHEEVGKLLGLSAKAVELRVYRARKMLAEKLGQNLNLQDL